MTRKDITDKIRKYKKRIKSEKSYNSKVIIFIDAVVKGFVDVVTYNIMIKAASDANDVEYAKDLFKEAKEQVIADVVTYNIMIKAASNANDVEYARFLFKEAKEHQ